MIGVAATVAALPENAFGTAIQLENPNGHASIALPSSSQEAVNSWQRTIAACSKEHRPAKYREACFELLRLAADQFHSEVSQGIVDRLCEMARANDISDKDAQDIMARARRGAI